MHLRRALLLFAIVLGFAAIAASLAPPPPDRRDAGDERPAPALREPRPAPERDERDGGPVEVRLRADAEPPERRRLEEGAQAVVTVTVDTPGEVSIEELGLLQSAEPRTPAVFDLLPSETGSYEVTFTPVDGEPRPAGVLVVRPANA